ncbi:hypothetical protein [Aurantibacillus circumpalustris]|uniref:hypothetical protein n=1 Tax=Aurantibacillus circumpalustris TaxID=3036359 RepID=UPI00295BB305|nr:hypothetical protein [Aurantibacillus circumpalustris]
MKKILLLTACVGLISLTSCKKDRVCECTNTYTSSSGNVTTDPASNITYKNISGGDAKSLCQKSTTTYVNQSGDTSIQVSDCKLK